MAGVVAIGAPPASPVWFVGWSATGGPTCLNTSSRNALANAWPGSPGLAAARMAELMTRAKPWAAPVRQRHLTCRASLRVNPGAQRHARARSSNSFLSKRSLMPVGCATHCSA